MSTLQSRSTRRGRETVEGTAGLRAHAARICSVTGGSEGCLCAGHPSPTVSLCGGQIGRVHCSGPPALSTDSWRQHLQASAWTPDPPMSGQKEK